MKLNEIRDNRGARTVPHRVGRGIGSGWGKTSGKGQKGQKARTGVALKSFEGGQNPLYRRLPKRGFKNPFTKEYRILNLYRIEAAVNDGLLDAAQPITAADLVLAGLIRGSDLPLRILGTGDLTQKLTIEATSFTPSAQAKIEAVGGTAKTL